MTPDADEYLQELSSNDRHLFGHDRRHLILSAVKRFGSVGTHWAASTFGVADATIRRDFKLLEKDGQVELFHGGLRLSGVSEANGLPSSFTSPPDEEVVVVAIISPKSGAYQKVMEAFQIAVVNIQEDDAGCLLYALHETDNGQLVIIEKWQDSSCLEAHGSSPAVQKLNETMEGLLLRPVEVIRMGRVQLGSIVKGSI